jgi:hypothetical protein
MLARLETPVTLPEKEKIPAAQIADVIGQQGRHLHAISF